MERKHGLAAQRVLRGGGGGDGRFIVPYQGCATLRCELRTIPCKACIHVESEMRLPRPFSPSHPHRPPARFRLEASLTFTVLFQTRLCRIYSLTVMCHFGLCCRSGADYMVPTKVEEYQRLIRRKLGQRLEYCGGNVVVLFDELQKAAPGTFDGEIAGDQRDRKIKRARGTRRIRRERGNHRRAQGRAER